MAYKEYMGFKTSVSTRLDLREASLLGQLNEKVSQLMREFWLFRLSAPMGTDLLY